MKLGSVSTWTLQTNHKEGNLMKRIVSVGLLVLVALVCFIGPVDAEPGVQNGDSLAIVIRPAEHM